MTIIQSIILGLVQGITEYLPISSSAHLIIFPTLLNWNTHSLSYDLALHLGTLLAILIFFRAQIRKLFLPIFSKDSNSRKISYKAIRNIIISTLAVIPFYIVVELIGDSLHQFSILTVIALILFGIFMIAISYVKNGDGEYSGMSKKQAGLIGFAQSIALIPGVSRSGITIMTSLLMGLKKREASEYSFLVSIPVILGGFLLDLIKTDYSGATEPIFTVMIGVISSFVGGYLAIKFLMNYLNNHSLAIFGYYRIILGVILLLLYFI